MKAALAREEDLLREKRELLQRPELLAQEFEHRVLHFGKRERFFHCELPETERAIAEHGVEYTRRG